MLKTAEDRRVSQRFRIHLPVHFRVSQRGASSRWGSGVTCDISAKGISFRCRRPLPAGRTNARAGCCCVHAIGVSGVSPR